jgi:hypothetical protein
MTSILSKLNINMKRLAESNSAKQTREKQELKKSAPTNKPIQFFLAPLTLYKNDLSWLFAPAHNHS